MKPILAKIFFFISACVFSQTGNVNGKVTSEDKSEFPGLTILIVKDGKTISGTQTDIQGNYQLKNIPFGFYDIKINSIGYRDKVIPNFEVNLENKVFDFVYPEPCIIVKKVCPKNHTDNIIPIVYGFPTKKMMKASKKEKVKLGGCDPSLCEKWFCKTHQLEF